MQFRFWKKNKLVPKVANKGIVVLQKCRILKSLHGPYFKNLININLKFRFCFISSICGMDFIKFQYKLYLDKLAMWKHWLYLKSPRIECRFYISKFIWQILTQLYNLNDSFMISAKWLRWNVQCFHFGGSRFTSGIHNSRFY